MRRVILFLMAITLVISLNSKVVSVNDQETGVTVLSEVNGTIELEYRAGSFTTVTTTIDGIDWNNIYLKGESTIREAGFPQLPQLNRSVILGNDTVAEIEVIESEYIEYDLAVLPSKGTLLRTIDPATIPYTFSDIYESDEFWPAEQVTISTPYIFRDFRGADLDIIPFSYNGAERKLRFYTRMVIEIHQETGGTVNVKADDSAGVLPYFDTIYSKHFINYNMMRYTVLNEEAGRMLIICYSDFMDEMQPFVDWKIQKGIATEIVDVNTIGNSSVSIQNLIDAEYADGGLVWVLLVGDNAQVATKSYSGAGGDPQYSYLSGGDYYSEIFVGRFSAESEVHVETQVERSIYYERDVIDGDWMQKGMGVASSQGSGSGHYGEADYIHIGYIRDDLLDYDYIEVDEIYATNGGNASMVANALNEGRGIVNYCGHGSNTSWVTTGFNNSYVNALTNDYMLPVINSIACVNGNFTSTTCFAEAWMRAMNGDAPTGATAIFASSINQSWAPPMYAQDESIDLMCAEDLNTLGGLWFNGVSYMIDESNDTSMARTWHIFGDPSLQVRTKTPEAINATYSPTIQNIQESYIVDTGMEGALVSLSYDGELIASAYSLSDGIATLFPENLPEMPVTLTLTITGYNKITEIEDVELIFDGGAYVQMMGYDLLSGTNNILEPGESALLGISLFNVGAEASDEIILTLTTNCEFIEMVDNTEVSAAIPAGGSIDLDNCFSFSVTEGLLNNTPVTFEIEAVSGESVWNYTMGEIGLAEEGIISLTDAIDISLDLGASTTAEFTVKNNNYEGDLDYLIFVNETTGRSLTGSTVSCNAMDFIPGETTDWTFTCENNSTDLEWITDIEITFPAGVIVNSAGDFTGGDDDLEFQGNTGNGTTCIWHGETTTGWGYLHNGETATATVNVSISSGFMGNVELNWALTGDDYGQAPHNVEGVIELTTNGEPVSWLSVETLTGSLAGGESQVHSMSFDTSGLEEGIYTADISIVSGNNTEIVPVTLYAGLNSVDYGDIDDNGYVESFDSSILLQALVGISPSVAPLPWEEWRQQRADVDGDNAISAYDAGLILQYTVGLIAEFPAETGRLHEAPLGDIDMRIREEAGLHWLDLYAQGEVFGFRVSIRNRELQFMNPEVTDDILVTYNSNNGINRFAGAGSSAIDTEDSFMSIPFEYNSLSAEQEVTIIVNGREQQKTIYLEGYEGEIPDASRITGNYPNPFNPETKITYQIAEQGNVKISIYNIRGQLVKELLDETKSKGSYQVIWDGSNSNGEITASGTYLCRMQSSSGIAMRKLVLMK